jgi:ABC-type lipoprotein release transport system permease subunit
MTQETRPRIFTRAIITIAALGTIGGYLISHGLSIKVKNDREAIVWAIETNKIDWQPIVVSSVVLAALYTGRIDWVIDAAEKWADRDTKDDTERKKG